MGRHVIINREVKTMIASKSVNAPLAIVILFTLHLCLPHSLLPPFLT